VVERGFRFLKDPMFFTASVFLKNPKRVAALAMVMGLCLLVYALGERMVREALAKADDRIRDQRKASPPSGRRCGGYSSSFRQYTWWEWAPASRLPA
jgi:hypothetical protein